MSDTPTVHVLLSRVMEDVQAVKKADRNTQQNYSFRGVDAVVNAVGPALRKHGVIPVPHKVEQHYRDVQTSTGKPSRECTVVVTYRFYGPKGDFIEAQVPGESMDFGDKGAPKAMSVAYRILLLQALCIPTDEPEPDASSYERASGPSDAAVKLSGLIDDTDADADALRDLWRRVSAARKSNRITDRERDALLGRITKRLEALKPAEEEPSPATTSAAPMDGRQRNQLFALFARAGLNTREEQLKFLSDVSVRDVTSRGDLTYDEAAHAIGHLLKHQYEPEVAK